MNGYPKWSRIAFFFDATAPVRPGRSIRPGRAVGATRPARAAGPVRPVDVTRLLAAAASALALIAAVVLAWWWWHPRPPKPYHLPPPVGHRTLKQPLAIELVIDQSGSNSSSDPHNLRITESAEVLRWLGRYTRPVDRVGVVQFSDRPVATLPLTPVRQAARKAQAATAADGRVANGGTDIGSAIARGVSKLGGAPAGSRRMLILFTDGASDAGVEASIPPAVAHARANGINVFMVALDADGTYDRSAQFWKSQHLSGIKRIHSARRGTVARPIAEAVLKETGQHLPH
jgi:von Willebrand factor type A domain